MVVVEEEEEEVPQHESNPSVSGSHQQPPQLSSRQEGRTMTTPQDG